MQRVLETLPGDKLRVLVIWQPVLGSDRAAPGSQVLARISDSRAAQYWDEELLFATQLKRKLEQDPGHTRPSCCEADGLPWDMVAVYAPGARWESQLPRAVLLDGAVVRVTSLSGVVKELLSGKPTNPAQP